MDAPAQRITLVLEHITAADETPIGAEADTWNVVAYLILDSGKRLRATLRRCKSRTKAAGALNDLWRSITH